MSEPKKLEKFLKYKNTMDEEGKAKSLIDKLLGDISKRSASKQLLMGAAAGWVTGFSAIKIGRTAAFAIGGGIILLEVANQKGYININWDKVNKEIDKVSDKVEEQITGQRPSWLEGAEKFFEKKMDKAEDLVKGGQSKAKHWYSSFTGGKSKNQVKEIHIFFVSFIAGVAIGIAT